MTSLNAATKQSLQNALYAHMHTYGSESIAEARAIAGSILTVKEKAGTLISKGLEIEAWVDELVEDFDPTMIAEQLWDDGEQAIAAQAQKWRETVEVKAQATMDAYIQKYAPDLNTTKIQDLVATVLPVVEDAKISRDETNRLIQTVSRQFNWQSAVERVIDPKWVMLADKTMQAVRNRDVEDSVLDVMNAYVYKFKPSAVEIGEGLIEQAVQAVSNSKVKLGLDFDLDAEAQNLIVKQVRLKFNLTQATLPPSTTMLEIAYQVYEAVARYRREQGLDDINYLPDITTIDNQDGSSQLGGEIGMGFALHPSADNLTANPDEASASS